LIISLLIAVLRSNNKITNSPGNIQSFFITAGNKKASSFIQEIKHNFFIPPGNKRKASSFPHEINGKLLHFTREYTASFFIPQGNKNSFFIAPVNKQRVINPGNTQKASSFQQEINRELLRSPMK
jgi:hypothetical protein